MKDLVCLVADRSIEAAVRGLLSRPEALGIRQVDHEIFVHPRRDPGCFHEADAFLGPLRGRYQHGLVVFDRAWDGAPIQDANELEHAVGRCLGSDGWGGVVVIEPELEAWVWSDSPHVEESLGWGDRTPALRAWLRQRGLWPAGSPKPLDPKAALEQALAAVRAPRSSAIHGNLARRVSVERCSDESFARFRSLLGIWFPG